MVTSPERPVPVCPDLGVIFQKRSTRTVALCVIGISAAVNRMLASAPPWVTPVMPLVPPLLITSLSSEITTFHSSSRTRSNVLLADTVRPEIERLPVRVQLPPSYDRSEAASVDVSRVCPLLVDACENTTKLDEL